jgi:hypothetical protein
MKKLSSLYIVLVIALALTLASCSAMIDDSDIECLPAVTTIAGTGSVGSADGTGTAASFNFPIDIVLNGSDVYVADFHNHSIRKLSPVE